MSLATASYRATLDAEAARLQLPSWDGILPGVWLEGQCLQESGGNPTARHYDGQIHPNDPDEGPFEDWASYGLFQIEGRTHKGLLGIPAAYRLNHVAAGLYLPGYNISQALRVTTSNLLETGPDVARALAIYNGGWAGGKRTDGKLQDQTYVDLVHAKVQLVLADRKASA